MCYVCLFFDLILFISLVGTIDVLGIYSSHPFCLFFLVCLLSSLSLQSTCCLSSPGVDVTVPLWSFWICLAVECVLPQGCRAVLSEVFSVPRWLYKFKPEGFPGAGVLLSPQSYCVSTMSGHLSLFLTQSSAEAVQFLDCNLGNKLSFPFSLLLQNCNRVFFAVEIKAFYQRCAFRKESFVLRPLRLKGGVSEPFCLPEAGRLSWASESSWAPGCQGTWCQRRAWSVPCSCTCCITSKEEAIFNQLFFLWRYKEKKLIYDFKRPKQSFRGIAECDRVCSV